MDEFYWGEEGGEYANPDESPSKKRKLEDESAPAEFATFSDPLSDTIAPTFIPTGTGGFLPFPRRPSQLQPQQQQQKLEEEEEEQQEKQQQNRQQEQQSTNKSKRILLLGGAVGLGRVIARHLLTLPERHRLFLLDLDPREMGYCAYEHLACFAPRVAALEHHIETIDDIATAVAGAAAWFRGDGDGGGGGNHRQKSETDSSSPCSGLTELLGPSESSGDERSRKGGDGNSAKAGGPAIDVLITSSMDLPFWRDGITVEHPATAAE